MAGKKTSEAMSLLQGEMAKYSWERSPSWRWNTCMQYLAIRNARLSSLKVDPYLLEGASYYRARYKFKESPKVYQKKFREVDAAYRLYFQSGHAQVRWFLEALLITERDCQVVADILKYEGVCKDVIACYRALFFDVEPFMDSAIALRCTILANAHGKATLDSFYDYTWKMYAYCRGPEKFADFITMNSKSKSMDNFHKDLVKDSMTMAALQASASVREGYNENIIATLTLAKPYWEMGDEDKNKKSGGMSATKDFRTSWVRHMYETVDVTMMDAKAIDVKDAVVMEEMAIEKRFEPPKIKLPPKE